MTVTAADYRCGNPHFVKSALARFTPTDFLSWIHAGCVGTAEEAGGKVFCRQGAVSMGVALALGRDVDEAKRKAIQTASQVRVQL